MSSGAELEYWLRLTQVPGLGAVGARRLLQTFGLPENIFAASTTALAAVVPLAVANNLLQPPSPQLAALIDRTRDWAGIAGNRIITLADPDYPASLLEIPDPPIMLYLKGRFELLLRPALAIVGSRNASVQGSVNAQRFAHVLAGAGITVVSGLALGIDTAAHQGSLAAGCDAGSTIAVIGTGIDIVYPARNHALAHQIAEQGCLISEYALGTAGIPANFPRRNRLISGLALGVLVVEAAARSGSLITARMALDQGRDVFAIPGSIHSALSKGCHQLIRQGAKLVESAEHIIEELPRLVSMPVLAGSPFTAQSLPQRVDGMTDEATPACKPEDPTGEEDRVLLALMGYDPFEPGQLADRCGWPCSTIVATLLGLELAGLVARLPGGLYQKLA